MSGYDFHPEARTDLDDIHQYISADNTDASDCVIADILATVRKLVSFPYKGYRRPDLTVRPLRFWRVRDYLIAYAPDEQPLWVLAVIHGSRSSRVMAAILSGREQ